MALSPQPIAAHDSSPLAQLQSRQHITCRHCNHPLHHSFADLGVSPLANNYIEPEDVARMQRFYPLHAYVCDQCWLTQLPVHVSAEDIFSEYAYFSSFSSSWLLHVSDYADMMTKRWQLGSAHRVIELASNDGYLLQYFQKLGCQVLGIEPAANVAEIAIADKGIPTTVAFFGVDLAKKMAKAGETADVLIANNVLAHVPDINDFVAGMKIVLKPEGIITVEAPHLLQLMALNQFDTIYHEHFSYLALLSVERIFRAHGLRIFDVEELTTHGGSLRYYGCHLSHCQPESPAVEAMRKKEKAAGLDTLATYTSFGEKVRQLKYDLLSNLITLKRQGKRIVGYGAPAKGNTLLNYCGIRRDMLDYTVDRNVHKKQGRFLPGTLIPILSPDVIAEDKPDFVLILPWNIAGEIMQEMHHIRTWGGQFIVPIPQFRIL